MDGAKEISLLLGAPMVLFGKSAGSLRGVCAALELPGWLFDESWPRWSLAMLSRPFGCVVCCIAVAVSEQALIDLA